MGTTWQERAADEGDRSPTAIAFNNSHASIDLRDGTLVGTDPYAVEKMFVKVLVLVAETGVDDELAGIFLRRWAAGVGDPPAVAAALGLASGRLRGVEDADSLATVDRWIAAFAAAPRRSRLRRVLRAAPRATR